MNISSYNISDVGYHYIGIRVLAALPPTVARREEQESAISRSVLKYVSDKALRLLLPEPRGTFQTIGEKVCRELVHFRFAISLSGAYELTELGKESLSLLAGGRYSELRRVMARVHLETYDNLRAVLEKHFEIGYIWRPIVETGKLEQRGYLQNLLHPTFSDASCEVATNVWEALHSGGAKKIETALQESVVAKVLPGVHVRGPLFRSIVDRLVSLRLLNVMKDSIKECEFMKSYSPCVDNSPPQEWYVPLQITPTSGSPSIVYFCEPDMTNNDAQRRLLDAIDETLLRLSPQGGYYDLPDVRDLTCERLWIPESSFDEGVNQLLSLRKSPLTMGLTYEKISGRRKPLVRSGDSSQIYNLIRRA